MRVDPK